MHSRLDDLTVARRDAAAMTLAHTLQNTMEATYRRGDLRQPTCNDGQRANFVSGLSSYQVSRGIKNRAFCLVPGEA
jgi:hypothetical protein